MPAQLEYIAAQARLSGLGVMGHAETSNGTTVLMGAAPSFWPIFTAAPEYADNKPDPLDRWSKRILGDIATHLDATCAFPSDGPPFPPFVAWAIRSGRFHHSPVGMLVHDTQGMMFSLRGALFIKDTLPQTPPQSPCDACSKPCETACPVNALTPDVVYDLPACLRYLDTTEGSDCMTKGCATRRACPLSTGRVHAQSAFHMQAFHPTGAPE